jgi:hypothetical protein
MHSPMQIYAIECLEAMLMLISYAMHSHRMLVCHRMLISYAMHSPMLMYAIECLEAMLTYAIECSQAMLMLICHRMLRSYAIAYKHYRPAGSR